MTGRGRTPVARPAALLAAAVLLGMAALAFTAWGGGGAVSAEERADRIAAGLRCPVCADLSAADSPAPIARQMRHQILRQVERGVPDAQIRQRFVDAYGPSVLLTPRADGWGRVARVLPVAVAGAALVGGAVVAVRARRRTGPAVGGQVAVPAAPRPPAVAPGRSRLRTLAAVLAVATGVAVLAGTQLAGAIDQRPKPLSASPPGTDTDAAAPASATTEQPPAVGAHDRTALRARVRAAEHRVRRAPRAPAAHLALAGAYAEAGEDRLATIEYLATRQLDPDSVEANTALALAAFTSGDPRTAKSLVDRALRAEPRYPEALYTRALVEAMGLRDQAAAERDLRAYLRAAPFGSHRTSVETLLALLEGGER